MKPFKYRKKRPTRGLTGVNLYRSNLVVLIFSLFIVRYFLSNFMKLLVNVQSDCPRGLFGIMGENLKAPLDTAGVMFGGISGMPVAACFIACKVADQSVVYVW